MKKILLPILLSCSALVFAQEQVITPNPASQSLSGNSTISFAVNYSTANPVDETLTGLGLRMHFNSSQVTFNSLADVFTKDLTSTGVPQADAGNFDGDATTDMFVVVAWTSFTGAWPGVSTAQLYTASFTTAANFVGTTIKFSASSLAAGRTLLTTSVALIGETPKQVVAASPLSQSVGTQSSFSVGVGYTTEDPVDATLSGLGLRMHFNSSLLAFDNASSILAKDRLILSDPIAEPDTSNFDGDSSTDMFVQLAWASFTGEWPGESSVNLYYANFTSKTTTGSTAINFSDSSHASGRTFVSTPASITITEQQNQAPTGSITSPSTCPATVVQGDSLNFQADAADADNNLPLAFEWTRDGVVFSTEEDAGDLLFDTEGTFVVAFKVTDSLGVSSNSNTCGVVVTSSVNNPPTDVVITLPGGGNTLNVNQGQTVTLQGAGVDPEGAAVTFAWNFGGAAANTTAQNPTVTFNTPGSFTITLVVVDALGATTAARATVVVAAVPPVVVSPIPTLSEWAMIMMSVLLMSVAVLWQSRYLSRK